ncbi:leukotriene A-4 hydrolase-like [Uloborus diversus]|uniref:leukotriene A-4 hydrolase-like n=1 Tax=Uloborus diversus TaxID=327109 RepID=UPI00240A68A0|nr:leukotriene A-4 hydrolase-like [Uloborus diversus]
MSLSKNDPNSFSNPEECTVSHIDLRLEVDFKKHILKGCVNLSVERNTNASLVLDTRDLTILNVYDGDTLQKLGYSLGNPVTFYGSKLEINLTSQADSKKCRVCIDYETSPKCSALQWLKPNQTSGKKHPYLFSQCQPIHARSMLPCQDTPGIKTPYNAVVTAPSELTVLMSAVKVSEDLDESKLIKSHTFKQKVPIPSYLIAIVVGALEKRKIGPRSHIWSEKEYVDKAAEEFSETEQMISTAEDLLGEYVWGIYDLLVLPPSFPYGGMENPCLTFLTPTLLAGDKSLADVVAHEISHSWTGNLVTNRNFEHFWLNEGFTCFVENKIVGRMHGESARHLHALEGWELLEYAVETYGEKNPLTKLVLDLRGIDPDDAFSSVPYEKGHTLLFYLETLLGGADVFDKFLRAYIQEYKYKSIDTDTWKMFLYKYFSNQKDVLDKVDWNAWLYTPGMPPVKPEYDCSLAKKCMNLAGLWTQASAEDLDQFSAKDIAEFSSYQLQKFLSFLLQEESFPLNKIEKLTDVYGLKNTRNSEVQYRWIRLGLKAQWKGIIDSALEFVTTIGRMKFIRPIYRDMYAWDETREKAISVYYQHRDEMMYQSASAIAKDLHISETKTEHS